MSGGAADVGASDDFADGTATRVEIEVDGEVVPVAVVRVGERLYAVADTCTHANVSLSQGTVWCDELELECPKHGSAFSLTSGEPSSLPATQPVSVFGADIVDGRVLVEAIDADPGATS